MKNKKTIAIYTSTAVVLAFGVIQIANLTIIGLQKSWEFINNPLGDYLDFTQIQVPYKWADETKKEYTYNEQVPVEIIKNEIIKQAEIFGNDIDFMLDLAECESTFNNLADNPDSTAKGIYQFVALTWEATESNKKHISEFDYVANIREANIKIANGEYSHWNDCLSKK